MPVATKKNSLEEQASIASVKELRARDAALAVREYQQEKLAAAARTEQLRALRLARDNPASGDRHQPSDGNSKKTETTKPQRSAS